MMIPNMTKHKPGLAPKPHRTFEEAQEFTASWYYMGVDLGQAQDYTAICILEQVRVPEYPSVYNLVHLERVPLNTSYPSIVELVKQRLEAIPTANKNRWRPDGKALVELAVDGTGVVAGLL